MSKAPRSLTLLLAIILLSLALPVEAQEGIHFETVTATGHFPEEILFTVIAEGDSDIVNLELSYRVTGTPYTSSRWAESSPASRVQTTFRLDTQVEFYPPGAEFHYYWTATDVAGNVVESPEQVLRYEDNRFTWQEASTDRVAILWYEGDEDFGQAVLDVALRALSRLEEDAGVQAERQIRIYLYARSSDFRGALGPNSPEWIGGQALPHLGLIVAHITSSDLGYEVERIIPHELSHRVLYQATHNPYANNPNWLEEGIAVHNQEVADYDFPGLVEDAAREGRLIPLRALSASFPSDTDLALLSYAESSSIVEFILEEHGPEGLSALVDVFAEGETAEEGVRRALGITLDELEAQWRATLPAAERTPVPGTTPQARPRQSQGQRDAQRNITTGIAILASAACAFLIAVGAVVAGVIIIVRRSRPKQPGGDPQGGQPPIPPGRT